MVAIIRFVFEILEGIIGGIFEGGGSLIEAIFSKKQKTAYDADFMPASKILSKNGAGFNLTGSQTLDQISSFSNASIYGPSGSGKSSSVILPSIYSIARGGATICIHDPSGELYAKSSSYLAGVCNYIVQRIDFSDSKTSEGFNPLARCASISDIQKVVQLTIRNTVGDTKGDPFWDRSCAMLITLFARYLVFFATPEYRTMTNVLRLVETFAVYPKKLDRLFVETGDAELLSQYKAFIVYGDKTLQSIIATARAALNIFSDPSIIATTSVDTLDFTNFRKEKVALFVCNPTKDMHYYKPLSALFFESLFNEIMSRIPANNERPIFCLLDEALMKFSALSMTVSQIRKYRAGLMLVVQDYQAWVSIYGQAEAHNIRTNTFAQVYLKGQPLETCRELEAILGRFTYTDEQGIERTRLLMSADEIRKSEEAIILCGNHAPIRAKMRPYYTNWRYRKYAAMPPQPLSSKLPTTTPPLIPLDDA
jgi:type IV secretion system protein VirD4